MYVHEASLTSSATGLGKLQHFYGDLMHSGSGGFHTWYVHSDGVRKRLAVILKARVPVFCAISTACLPKMFIAQSTSTESTISVMDYPIVSMQ